MARKTASRLELRKQAEAAEKLGTSEETTTKKKASRKKTTTRTSRKKTAAPTRKRLVWAIFSGSMKEEARFPYAERAQAEEKLEQLRSKGKKLYFIQPMKEELDGGGASAPVKKAKAKVKAKAKRSDEEE